MGNGASLLLAGVNGYHHILVLLPCPTVNTSSHNGQEHLRSKPTSAIKAARQVH